MRRVIAAIILLPVMAQADDFLQLRHVVGSDGVGYTVIRADPANLIAGPILSSLTATANATGYSCLVMRDSQFAALASTWTGIQAAMAANHFTLTQEQQSYCTDAVIPPYVPPAPATLYASGQMWAVVKDASGNQAVGAAIGFVPPQTPCEGLKFTVNGVNYYDVHITNATTGAVREAVVKVCQ